MQSISAAHRAPTHTHTAHDFDLHVEVPASRRAVATRSAAHWGLTTWESLACIIWRYDLAVFFLWPLIKKQIGQVRVRLTSIKIAEVRERPECWNALPRGTLTFIHSSTPATTVEDEPAWTQADGDGPHAWFTCSSTRRCPVDMPSERTGAICDRPNPFFHR